jgi:alpha-L-rhamnosidase
MLAIERILVDHRINPLDASLNPEFAWTFQADSTGEQVSYRLLVASDSSFKNIVWDSGLVKSEKNFGIKYAGSALANRTPYFVRLIVNDNSLSLVSFDSHFETVLSSNQWLGTWIGTPVSWNGGALSIRRAFDKFDAKKIVRARAYIAGIGYSEFYVNGEKVGDAVLDPGVTDYDKRVLFNTYDIAPYLNGNEDVVGVLLGYGWYGNRKLRAQFYIDFEDGTTYEAHSYSNYGWWFSKSPITRNSIYSGETYDARIEDEYPGGFTSQSLKGNYNYSWYGGTHIQSMGGELVPQELNPIRVLGDYPGKVRTKFSDSDFVYDIFQNIAGWCEIKVQGSRGDVIKLRHSETLKDDGHIDQTNLRTADAEDVYILKGEGVETYSPRFTYHGFRYIEVTIEGKAKVLSLVGKHVHSDNTQVGSFDCSDSAINKLHKMAVITEQNNETSILTDCPQRDERFGWLNDVSTRVFQTCYNFDMDRFFNKVDRDMSLCADEEGAITDTAPYYTGGRPADVTSLSYLLLARESYRYYGDDSTCVENYQGHKAWVEYLLRHSHNYIMDYYYYADWVSCDNFKDGHSDGICISSIFLYWHLVTLSELARIVGNEVDAKHYASLALESKKALNKKYLKDDCFFEGTQCEDAMSLNLGIIPEDKKTIVYNHLKKSVIDHNYHITCGNQGYRHVMYLLAENGDIDILLKVLTNPEYPGWGFMLKNDATTVWERWEKENLATMNSFDHPMFGSYDATFYRYLGGIKINDMASNDIEVSPKVPSTIDFVNSSLITPRGKLVSNWKKKGTSVLYDIEVPANMRVKVTIEGKDVTLDGKKMKNTVTLQSGRYHLEAIQ